MIKMLLESGASASSSSSAGDVSEVFVKVEPDSDNLALKKKPDPVTAKIAKAVESELILAASKPKAASSAYVVEPDVLPEEPRCHTCTQSWHCIELAC